MHTNRLFQSFRHHQPCNTFFQKLAGQLNIPSNVLLFIINFLSCRTQAVSSFGQTSSWLPISQSIIQGSGIGPYLMVYASDLQTLSPYNVIIKYADDTTLLVGQHSSVDIWQECSWSVRNKLTINTGKTKEIVFHLLCQTLNEYLRLHYWESTSLSASVYVNNYAYTQINQRYEHIENIRGWTWTCHH